MHPHLSKLKAGAGIEAGLKRNLIAPLGSRPLTGMRQAEPLLGQFDADRVLLASSKQGVGHTVCLKGSAQTAAASFPAAPGLSEARQARRLGRSRRWQCLLRLAALQRAGITIHDLRRTWATHAARAGVGPFVIELCLGHAPNGGLGKIGAAYCRHSCAERRAEAWERVSSRMAATIAIA